MDDDSSYSYSCMTSSSLIRVVSCIDMPDTPPWRTTIESRVPIGRTTWIYIVRRRDSTYIFELSYTKTRTGRKVCISTGAKRSFPVIKFEIICLEVGQNQIKLWIVQTTNRGNGQCPPRLEGHTSTSCRPTIASNCVSAKTTQTTTLIATRTASGVATYRKNQHETEYVKRVAAYLWYFRFSWSCHSAYAGCCPDFQPRRCMGRWK